MEDRQIVDLYWARDERAISESDAKYGRMLHALSYACLSSHEDCGGMCERHLSGRMERHAHRAPDLPWRLPFQNCPPVSIDRFRHDHRLRRGGLEA